MNVVFPGVLPALARAFAPPMGGANGGSGGGISIGNAGLTFSLPGGGTATLPLPTVLATQMQMHVQQVQAHMQAQMQSWQSLAVPSLPSEWAILGSALLSLMIAGLWLKGADWGRERLTLALRPAPKAALLSQAPAVLSAPRTDDRVRHEAEQVAWLHLRAPPPSADGDATAARPPARRPEAPRSRQASWGDVSAR